MDYILLSPMAAGLIAQTIKLFINSNKKGFKFKNILAYSGMPSGHSAMVISLVTSIYIQDGIHSSSLAVSAILAIVVIRDAVGIRKYLGRHGETLNILVEDLEDDNVLEHNYPHLLEKIGHTPLQVLAGSIIGVLTSILFYFFL